MILLLSANPSRDFRAEKECHSTNILPTVV
jgi:hypothetical protein